MSSVLIVDDHPLFRNALDVSMSRTVLADADIKQASSLKEALDNASEQTFDLILLDLNLGDAKGFEGLTQFRAFHPNVPIIVVSATNVSNAFQKAHALGANGYITKDAALEDIANSINEVLSGNAVFPAFEETQSDASSKMAELTPAQKKVMTGLSNGLLNKQIAYEMGISEATVKAHMTSIFRKLGANNRTQALLIYRQATRLEDQPI